MDLYEVFSVVAVIVSVASSTFSLGYWLAKRLGNIELEIGSIESRIGSLESRINSLELRINSLESRIGSLESRFSSLERAFYDYNELLLKILGFKGILTSTEIASLITVLRTALPHISSRYYTREVMERLKQLLSKNPDEYTMDDVKEMWEISEIMLKEYSISGRKDLLDYSSKLKIASQLIKIFFVEPKMKKMEEWLHKL
ncbi:MAG: hypothetical protein QW803_10100 [Candidatus Methanomethylicia archaeon]